MSSSDWWRERSCLDFFVDFFDEFDVPRGVFGVTFVDACLDLVLFLFEFG